MAVRYRQRIDPAVISCAEPALEIGSPLIVGRRDRRNGALLVDRPPPPLGRRNQPRPLLRMSPIVDATGQQVSGA
jgi:hypothetical protein